MAGNGATPRVQERGGSVQAADKVRIMGGGAGAARYGLQRRRSRWCLPHYKSARWLMTCAHSFARGIFVEGVAQRRACERHDVGETHLAGTKAVT